jgi:hypothetical protein
MHTLCLWVSIDCFILCLYACRKWRMLACLLRHQQRRVSQLINSFADMPIFIAVALIGAAVGGMILK